MQTQLSLQQLSALNKEFIATASHDLRKPLSVIHDIADQARLKLATNKTYDAELMLQDLTLITQSSSYMQGIAECIVDSQTTGFGQIRLTRAPLHVEAVIAEVVERHRERANEKKIALMSKHASEKLIVDADRIRISQVLDNYVGNAIKFCSAGDSITISVKQESDSVRVDVTDSGPGLTEDDMQKLFMQDVELSNKPTDGESSTGLGLSICKQLIDLHEGQLGAFNNEATGDENESSGTTFWFSLPLFKIKSVDLS